MPSLPCQSPPINIFPPEVSVFAVSFAFPSITTSLPVIAISAFLSVFDLAVISPASWTPPLSPASIETIRDSIFPEFPISLITPFSLTNFFAGAGDAIVCSTKS